MTVQVRKLFAITILMIGAVSIQAKEGVQATVHTKIPAVATDGQKLDIGWSLKIEKTGEPFTACAVFIRLISVTNESTEAFTKGCNPDSEGHYHAIPIVPKGGIAKVEIGIAGTLIRDGQSMRSDWLIPLANDPLSH